MKTIETKEKLALVAKDESRLKYFAEMLEFKKGDIVFDIKRCNIFSNDGYNYGLYVDADDYNWALTELFEMVPRGSESIAWIDINNDKHSWGYIPIMHCVLPQTQSLASEETAERVRKYKADLMEFCAADIKLEYNHSDNTCIFLAKASFSKHELMIKRCRGFNYVNEHTPFIETYYPDWKGSLDVDFEEVKKERIDKLESYFDNSLCYYALSKPADGFSIMPWVFDIPKNHRSYKRECWYDGITKSISDGKLYIKGKFKTRTAKDEPRCNVIEEGLFTSKITIVQNRVSMTTTIDVSRKIEGENFDDIDIRDAFFPFLSKDGGSGSVTYTEHFVVIDNGTKLLHYSEEYEPFEIFVLPTNWFIENGLPKTYSASYICEGLENIVNEKNAKEVERLKQTEFFDEICEILKTRKISQDDKRIGLSLNNPE